MLSKCSSLLADSKILDFDFAASTCFVTHAFLLSSNFNRTSVNDDFCASSNFCQQRFSISFILNSKSLVLSRTKPRKLTRSCYQKYAHQSTSSSDGKWKCIIIKSHNNKQKIILFTAGRIYPLYAAFSE